MISEVVKRNPSLVFSRKRKRSSASKENPDFVLPDIHRDQIAKHRACWIHLMAFKYDRWATRKQAEEIKDEYDTAHCFFDSIHHGKRSKRSKPADPIPFQATKMSTQSFADHLESIWSSVAENKREHFSYLECLWFGLYQRASQRTKVLSWIKKRGIFSRNYNYVFVPLCCWSHWSLLILCHFGESLDSETRKPCMLLLDSLHMADPMRFELEIRKFVLDIYKEEGITDNRVSKIPLLIPKVPQQTNKECGSFVLYFIKKFMDEPPETFSNGHPQFTKQNWFTREEFNRFCAKLEKVSKARQQLEANSYQEPVLYESCKDGDVIIIDD